MLAARTSVRTHEQLNPHGWMSTRLRFRAVFRERRNLRVQTYGGDHQGGLVWKPWSEQAGGSATGSKPCVLETSIHLLVRPSKPANRDVHHANTWPRRSHLQKPCRNLRTEQRKSRRDDGCSSNCLITCLLPLGTRACRSPNFHSKLLLVVSRAVPLAGSGKSGITGRTCLQ